MPADRADSAGDEPDVPFDYEDEDEIMTELRQVRREMLVEFPTDEALFYAMKAHEAERIRQGVDIVTDLPD